MTPIHPDPSSYFSPRPSHTPGKRLRSCLSPTRTPSGSSTPVRPSCSRATSFGSECSMPSVDGWRRRKSVRWEGGENDEDCAVTSYHPTWSATEYDRTPLPPPSAAERTCVLPERGSRTFTTTYDCFHDDPASYPNAEEEEEGHIPSSPSDDITNESLMVVTPRADSPSPGGCGDREEDEDRQWEECMERRRMMFAMRSKSEEFDRQPEFEGYRSISAKLVDMLRSIEARRQPSPDTDNEEDDHPLQTQVIQEEDEEDFDESEVEDEADIRSYSSFTFTNLQSLNITTPPVDSTHDEAVDTDTESTSFDLEATTPSLISSAESEGDISIVSPRPSLMTPPPFAIAAYTGLPREKSDQRAVVEISSAMGYR